jgi:hypothetical protein
VAACRAVYDLPSLAPWIVVVCENLHCPREPFSFLHQFASSTCSPKVQLFKNRAIIAARLAGKTSVPSDLLTLAISTDC